MGLMVEYFWLRRFLPLSIFMDLMWKFKFDVPMPSDPGDYVEKLKFHWFTEEQKEKFKVPILVPMDISKVWKFAWKPTQNSKGFNKKKLFDLYQSGGLSSDAGLFHCQRIYQSQVTKTNMVIRQGMSVDETRLFSEEFVQAAFNRPGVFVQFRGSSLPNEICCQVGELFEPPMDRSVELRYCRDADTCAVSSFACAVDYIGTVLNSVRYGRVMSSLAIKADVLANVVGDGLVGFEEAIGQLFEQFNKKLWVRRVVYVSKSILEMDLSMKLDWKEKKTIYMCTLLTSDGGNDHVVSVFNGYIFDNNFPCAIPLSFENLSLCGGFGNDTVKYVNCSSIIEWNFGPLLDKNGELKRK